MENESLGKVLPRILFPYAQQWAESSGSALLSRLLVDEQFRGLVEKYADDMVTSMAGSTTRNGNGRSKPGGAKPNAHENDADADDLARLHDRVEGLEAQQAMQEALFEGLRIKIRPLALALGCCPECVVGIVGCPKCGGVSKVGHYPPDYALLEAQIVSPLAALGVPLCLEEKKVSGTGRRPKATTTTRKEKKA
jgi:hypothetical protein